jgi:ABC-type phosphate transport system substrate-binding protein
MIRLLLALLIVALLLTAVSRMQGLQQSQQETPPDPEETIVGSQLAPYNKAQQFSEDYENALQEKREELDEQIDDG